MEADIKVGLKETGNEEDSLIQLAREGVQWRIF
jgi:hypothetical protein